MKTNKEEKLPRWAGAGAAALILVTSGLGYRLAARRLEEASSGSGKLAAALNAFPTQIGNWKGIDVLIPEIVRQVAGNDDSLSRLYVNQTTSLWVNLYLAYSAHPRTMIGHRPDACYVGAGWIHDSSEQMDFTSQRGRKIPCLLHRFHLPGPKYEEIVVLNFYVANGEVSNDEKRFSGLAWRTPNIGGRAARYVAQVQISSVLEKCVRAAAEEFSDLILDMLPDERGHIAAAPDNGTTQEDAFDRAGMRQVSAE